MASRDDWGSEKATGNIGRKGSAPTVDPKWVDRITSRYDKKTEAKDEAKEKPAAKAAVKSAPSKSAKPANAPAPVKKSPKRRKRTPAAASRASSGEGNPKGRNSAHGGDRSPKLETESTAPKEAPQIGGKYQSPNRQLANLPTRSVPKKRGKLRRAASAVGRGFRRVFKGRDKRQAQKRESNQGKSVRV